ncbi:sensor domain-containing diguanylate cyclase [Rhizobium sp. 2MFCol3.1]|uniref:sensor domain-containing diguanylate cyclase n=1 Tax=Rhizobium sp. 2MFCol3.1 TaxID=1246459 RepID=UPI0032AEBC0A
MTILSGGAFIISAKSIDEERLATERAWRLDEQVEALSRAAERTTEDARLYIQKGDSRYLKAFEEADANERARGKSLRALDQSRLSVQEAAALSIIVNDAELLDEIEERAVKDFANGEQEKARAAVFSAEHEEAQSGLLASVAHFTDLVATRTEQELASAKAKADLWGAVAKSLLLATALLFLSVLYFVLKRRVARPLLEMSGIVRRLAKQDYDVQVLPDGRTDEIGDMNAAIQVFRDNGIERDRLDAERRMDQQTKDLILQLMHRLQACRDEAELADVVPLFAVQIFPGLSGRLYIMNDGRTALTAAGTWNDPVRSSQEFQTFECWGLRRGRPHMSDSSEGDVLCQHLNDALPGGSLCVPLAAHGDIVGMLYFESVEGTKLIAARVYIELIAENLGLAIANLQLRNRLTNLATKDALTGLLNRRSLDESLNRLRREETDLPAALLMVDIDHFKRFNDDFGHDAGDFVMCQVAAIMADLAGTAGLAHRYGGEEFAVVLRNVGRSAAFEIAENIRHAIESTPINHLGRPLGTVTVSIGVASTEANQPPTTLMQRADAALLRAKSSGRNVTVADWTDSGGAGRLVG